MSRLLVTGFLSAVLLTQLLISGTSTEPSNSLKLDVSKVRIRDVSNENPSYFEYALPFVRRPDGAAPCIVNLGADESISKIPNPHLFHLVHTDVIISAIPQK